MRSRLYSLMVENGKIDKTINKTIDKTSPTARYDFNNNTGQSLYENVSVLHFDEMFDQ